MKKCLKSKKLPAPVGPYSQMVASNGFLFLSGQIALDPATGELVTGGIEGQAEAILASVKTVLEEQGSGMKSIVKITAYLTDKNEFTAFNTVYARYFQEDPPARTTVFVNALPKGAKVELDVIAALNG